VGIQFIKEDGTPKGAWIAVMITWIWMAVHVVAFLWSAGAENLAMIDAAFTAGSVSFVGMYFLKKYREGWVDESMEALDRIGGAVNRRDSGNHDLYSNPKNITAGIKDRE
jgi:hypothetical protein